MDIVTSTVFSPGATPGEANLDQMLVLPKHGLLAVADAISPGEPQRAAIRIALDTVRSAIERDEDVIKRFRRNPTTELRGRILTIIEDAFTRAAQELFAFGRRHKNLQITLDVVLMTAHEAFVGHVGDGRVYLIRRGLVHQLTVDHTGAEDASFDDIENNPEAISERAIPGRVLSRALGPQPQIRVESLCMELTENDRFIVTSYRTHRDIPDGVLHHHLVNEALNGLGPALIRCAPGSPLIAAAGQLGSGEPEVMDAGRSRLAILAPMPLFAHCTDRELRTIATATHPRQFAANTVLFNQGDPGTELYLVISGKIRIERDGKTIVVLGPGSNFGEMAMLDAPNRSASAVAHENCEVMIISRDSFFALLKGNPILAVKILWNMLLRLSANLRATSAALASAQQPKPQARSSDPTDAPRPRPIDEFELFEED